MFNNEAPIDFSKKQNRDSCTQAQKELVSTLPIRAIPHVGGTEVDQTFEWSEHTCPFDNSLTVSKWPKTNTDLAEKAIQCSVEAFKTWSKTPVQARCETLRKLAKLMRERKTYLMTIIMYEVAKTYHEADADVCEAIDFCLYYAEQMEALSGERLMSDMPGERNTYFYRAKGPSLVISPWNFPLAILCGMTVAPLVAGNTVIIKPAEQSCAVANEFYKLVLDAGFSSKVVQFLPGQGELVGAYLVRHKDTHIINFTGSKAVGLNIIQAASALATGQKHIKKVLAEMGGKNALIIDADADLDEAVVGALDSAFNFQGQKCSALSRLIVHQDIFDKFKKRFCQALDSIQFGRVDNPANKISAVIDEESKNRLLSMIEKNKKFLIYQKDIAVELRDGGNFVPPTVFESTDGQSELMQNEFFGPVVCLYKAKDLEHAIEVTNSTNYALTAGIFSRSPKNIEFARAAIEAGNFYINRSITGALVCRQPFGGYKLSGVGAKAGGPDYLRQFLEPHTVSENIMRRGFAPISKMNA